MEKALLPGDAVAWAHAHHLLNIVFGVIGKLRDLYTSCLLVPFEDVRTETDTGFAIRALGSINGRAFLQRRCGFGGFKSTGGVSLVVFTRSLVLPSEILPISKA
jgi:hypothetical protein